MSAVDMAGAPWRTTCVDVGPDTAWDRRVEATAGGDLAQTTLWAATRRRLGFRCLHVTVSRPDGSPVGGCLIYAKRVVPAIWVGFVPRGPLLFAERPQDAETVVREVVAVARRHGVRILVMQSPETGTALDMAATAVGFKPGVPSVAPEATLRLDLRQTEDQLLAGMSRMRRRNIRRALRADFEIGEERDPGMFHRLHVAAAVRQGFAPVTLDNLQAQYEALAPSGACAMLIARHGGAPVAGLWITRFAGVVTAKLSGWNAARPAPSHANEALTWMAIRWARERGAHTYDLGGFDRHYAELMCAGAPLPDGFRQKPSYFKLGFGGTPVLLPCARFVFTHGVADLALGHLAQRFLAMPGVLRLVKRMRNG